MAEKERGVGVRVVLCKGDESDFRGGGVYVCVLR